MVPLPNEILDQIFADCDTRTWLNACQADPLFRRSAQRALFQNVHLTARHAPPQPGANSSCKAFLAMLNERSFLLARHVKTLQLKCEFDREKQFEYRVVSKIVNRLRKLRYMEVLLIFRPNVWEEKDVRDHVDKFTRIMKESFASTLSLKCVYQDPAFISQAIGNRQSGATELVLRPHPATEALEMIYLPVSPGDDMKISHLHRIDLGSFIVEEDDVRSIATSAIALKDLTATILWSQSGNAIVAALSPLHKQLEILDLRRHPRCNKYVSPTATQEKTDFSYFTNLRVLRVSSNFWFQSISCKERSVPRKFTWHLENRNDTHTLLPTSLTDLNMRFDWPNGIFARQLRCQELFRKCPKSIQKKGFAWMIEWQRKLPKLERMALSEEVHKCEGYRNVGSDIRAMLTRLEPPKVVQDVFKERGVELDVQMLEFVRAD